MALFAPAAAVVAGHYVPLPKVKWLEKAAKTHGVEVPKSDAKGWEPLLNDWRLETMGKSAQAFVMKKIEPITTFLAEPQAEQEEALEGFQKKLDKLLEEKPFLKPFKQYGEDLVKDALKLTEEMGTTHSEKASQWTKWIQEGYKYKTLRNTGVGVVGTLAIGGLAVLLGPVLLVNSIFTRWQKDSMRVGLMQADDSMKHPNFFKLDGEEKQNPQKPAVA